MLQSATNKAQQACMTSIIWVRMRASWWAVMLVRLASTRPILLVLADAALQVSLDPVNPAISPYPPPFNQRLEEAYRKSSPSDPHSQHCILGPDFFNSTIYFQTQGEVRRCPRGTRVPCGCVGPLYLHVCVVGCRRRLAMTAAVHHKRLSAHACCRRPGSTFRRPLPSTMDHVADASRLGTVIALSSPF